jgi:sulfhydrogenase subunit alpha
VGGRAIHPVNAVVGGFGRVPEAGALRALQDQLAEALTWRKRVTGLLSSLALPSHTSASSSSAHSRQYAALMPEGEGFGFFGGAVTLADGLTYDVHDYQEVTNELTVSHSHAKHSRHQGRPYMVGSLARLVLHGGRIKGEGRRAMEELDLVTPADNVLLNNPAQAVELVYSLERAVDIIGRLLSDGLVGEEPVQPTAGVRRGEGTAATEVPRGTLYHSYAFGDDGRLTKADIITPTAQNLANIEQDIRICAENLKNSPRDEMLANFEMIVRAYDPCISCSVHLITLA